MKYVGARYVPKFMGTYDPTQDYEALSVVDNGMGTSYVSNKPAPAGTPLTDTDYWALYGATSGAIINLQGQIDALKEIAVTPEMFGAEGDGYTDDSAAIQQAVNMSKLVFMQNDYLVNTGVTIPAGVRVFGPGTVIAGDHINTFTVSGNNIIEGLSFTDSTALENEWAHIYGIDVNNVTVNGCTFSTIGLGYAVLFDHSTRINVVNNVIENYAFGGIMFMHTCSHSVIEHNRVYNSRWRGADHNYPICISGYQDHDFGPAHHIKCNFNYIEELAPWWEGIDSHGCNNYEIIGNTILNTFRGIALGYKRTGGTAFTRSNCDSIIRDNVIVTGKPTDISYEYSTGIHIASGDDCNTFNLEIRNNNLTCDSQGDSVMAAGISAIALLCENGNIKNIVIENNYIDATHINGIGIGCASASNILIKNNYIARLTGEYYGIFMADMLDFENVHVVDNTTQGDIAVTCRAFRGPRYASTVRRNLVDVQNFLSDLEFGTIDYTTIPHPTAGITYTQKPNGADGQFIPSKIADTFGYICQSSGTWIAVTGTTVT